MACWSEIEAEAPALAATGLGFLIARRHLTLATLRRDGSPRISGIELQHVDGDPPDHLLIESWHEGRGTTRLERR